MTAGMEMEVMNDPLNQEGLVDETDQTPEEAEIERRLSQKLLEGYVLLETACPACATPLVKQPKQDEESQPLPEQEEKELSDSRASSPVSPPMIVPSGSFDAPFRPVNGVPFCVCCQAHVVTDESEIELLEQCDSLKAKGSILVALQANDESQHSSMYPEPPSVIEAGKGASGSAYTSPTDSVVKKSSTDGDKHSGYDAASFLCGTTTSRQMVAPSPELVPESFSAAAAHVLSKDNENDNEEEEEDREAEEDAVKGGVTSPMGADFPTDGALPSQHDSTADNELPVEPSVSMEGHEFPTIDVTEGDQGVDLTLQSHEENMAGLVNSSVQQVQLPPEPVSSSLRVTGESDAERNVSKEHADEKKEEEMPQQHVEPEVMEEYSVRREVATKVLGSKMLQGYTLKDTQCLKCGMPLMEFKGQLDCVVCPALVKRAKKKKKEQQRLAEQEKAEREAQAARELEAARRREREEAEAKLRAEQEAARRKEQEAERRRKEKMEEERRRKEMEAEEERLRSIEEAEFARIREYEAEQARLQAVAKAREEEENARMEEEHRLANEARLRQVALLQEQRRLEKEARLEEEAKLEEARRRKEEMRLMEETRRLERIEELRRIEEMQAASVSAAMRRDLLLEEEKKCVSEQAQQALEIKKLEHFRLELNKKEKAQTEQLRAEDEARYIQALEDAAAEKARMAQQAIAKAKAAMDNVSTAKKDIIAQTIALAEAEAVAEAEGIIKAEREDYQAPIILPTQSEVNRERWETLRAEGRAIMTRRMMAGWTLTSKLCQGEECMGSPLIYHRNRVECVVCGGTGTGLDGAYAVDPADLEDDDDIDMDGMPYKGVPLKKDVHLDINEEMTAPTEDDVDQVLSEATSVASPTANKTVQEIQEDFETKRDMVSKEIGKRMLQGWTLMDMSCPNCVMPLMIDSNGQPEICVLCGLIERVTKREEKKKQKEIKELMESDDKFPVPLSSPKNEEETAVVVGAGTGAPPPPPPPRPSSATVVTQDLTLETQAESLATIESRAAKRQAMAAVMPPQEHVKGSASSGESTVAPVVEQSNTMRAANTSANVPKNDISVENPITIQEERELSLNEEVVEGTKEMPVPPSAQPQYEAPQAAEEIVEETVEEYTKTVRKADIVETNDEEIEISKAASVDPDVFYDTTVENEGAVVEIPPKEAIFSFMEDAAVVPDEHNIEQFEKQPAGRDSTSEYAAAVADEHNVEQFEKQSMGQDSTSDAADVGVDVDVVPEQDMAVPQHQQQYDRALPEVLAPVIVDEEPPKAVDDDYVAVVKKEQDEEVLPEEENLSNQPTLETAIKEDDQTVEVSLGNGSNDDKENNKDKIQDDDLIKIIDLTTVAAAQLARTLSRDEQKKEIIDLTGSGRAMSYDERVVGLRGPDELPPAPSAIMDLNAVPTAEEEPPQQQEVSLGVAEQPIVPEPQTTEEETLQTLPTAASSKEEAPTSIEVSLPSFTKEEPPTVDERVLFSVSKEEPPTAEEEEEAAAAAAQLTITTTKEEPPTTANEDLNEATTPVMEPPTVEIPPPPEETLADLIRQRSKRSSPSASDPPASLGARRRPATDPEDSQAEQSRVFFAQTQQAKERKVKKKRPSRKSDKEKSEKKKDEVSIADSAECISISLPKNFDFDDEASLLRLIVAARGQKGGNMESALATGTAVISAKDNDNDEVSRMTKEEFHSSVPTDVVFQQKGLTSDAAAVSEEDAAIAAARAVIVGNGDIPRNEGASQPPTVSVRAEEEGLKVDVNMSATPEEVTKEILRSLSSKEVQEQPAEEEAQQLEFQPEFQPVAEEEQQPVEDTQPFEEEEEEEKPMEEGPPVVEERQLMQPPQAEEYTVDESEELEVTFEETSLAASKYSEVESVKVEMVGAEKAVDEVGTDVTTMHAHPIDMIMSARSQDEQQVFTQPTISGSGSESKPLQMEEIVVDDDLQAEEAPRQKPALTIDPMLTVEDMFPGDTTPRAVNTADSGISDMVVVGPEVVAPVAHEPILPTGPENIITLIDEQEIIEEDEDPIERQRRERESQDENEAEEATYTSYEDTTVTSGPATDAESYAATAASGVVETRTVVPTFTGRQITTKDGIITIDAFSRSFSASQQGLVAQVLLQRGTIVENMPGLEELAREFITENLGSDFASNPVEEKRLAQALIKEFSNTYVPSPPQRDEIVSVGSMSTIEPVVRVVPPKVTSIPTTPTAAVSPVTARAEQAIMEAKRALHKAEHASASEQAILEAKRVLEKAEKASAAANNAVAANNVVKASVSSDTAMSKPEVSSSEMLTNDNGYASSAANRASRVGRPRVTPETMARVPRSRSRSNNTKKSQESGITPERPRTLRSKSPATRMMPPRPDSMGGYGSNRSVGSHARRGLLKPPTPKRKVPLSPRNAGVVVIGGPQDHQFNQQRVADDQSAEGSRAESVATVTLDAILSRIEACKSNLSQPGMDVHQQLETANLIEQLASAAVAVRRLEELELAQSQSFNTRF